QWLSFISTPVITHTSLPRRVPITVLIPPPPETPPPKHDSTPDEQPEDRTSSSEEPQTKRRKYRLKKDEERSDPHYKDMRQKNNESVRRTREKKKAEEEEERKRNEEERNELKGLVRIMMAREAYLVLANANLERNLPPPARNALDLREEMTAVQKRLYAEIRADFVSMNPNLAENCRKIRE
ncbi:hypothetical protein PFISCL1PPCAC_28108, partial [Pristionchus fissidentatus]